VVICLQRGADCLHMVQLMSLHRSLGPPESTQEGISIGSSVFVGLIVGGVAQR